MALDEDLPPLGQDSVAAGNEEQKEGTPQGAEDPAAARSEDILIARDDEENEAVGAYDN